MIALSPQTRVFVYGPHIDFRNGLDGLIGLVKTKVKEDPFSGALFVFRNRRATALKAIMYDGQGYWLFMKRLSEGRFLYWPKSESDEAAKLLARELLVLCWNGNPKQALMRDDWRPLSPT